MFEYTDGAFRFIDDAGKKTVIDLSDIGSKLLSESNITNPSSYMDDVMNGFFNAVIWFAKFLFGIVVKLYEVLVSGQGVVDSYIKTSLNTGAKTFAPIFDKIAPMGVVFLILFALYMHFKRQGSALKLIAVGLLTMAFARVMYLPMSESSSTTGVFYVYDNMNTLITDIGTEISSGVTTSNDSASILSQYFDKAIWQPYKGMNSDKSGDGVLTDEQLLSLLPFRDNDKDYKKMKDKEGNEKNIEAVVGTEKEPKVKNIRQIGGKFGYVLLMLGQVILIGSSILAFTLFAFVLKVSVVALAYLFPVLALGVFLPFLENILFQIGTKAGGALLFSSLMGVFSSLFMTFDSNMEALYNTLFVGDIILSFVMKLITYFLLWKYRGELGKMFNVRRLAPVNRMLSKFEAGKKVAQAGLEVVKKPAMGTMLLAGGALALSGGHVRKQVGNYQQVQSQKRFDNQVKKYQEQGDSFEVGTMKTAKAREEKVLRKKQRKQSFGKVKDGATLLYHDLMSRGYKNVEAPKRQHHINRRDLVRQRLQERKDGLKNSGSRVKALNQAIQFQKMKERTKNQSPAKFVRNNSVKSTEPMVDFTKKVRKNVGNVSSAESVGKQTVDKKPINLPKKASAIMNGAPIEKGDASIIKPKSVVKIRR